METIEHKGTTYNITDSGLVSNFYLKRNKKQLSDYREPQQSEIDHCIAWLNLYAAPQNRVNKSIGSYELKHIVEHWEIEKWGNYVSNGAFISAVYKLGYKIILDDPLSLNAQFCLAYDKNAIKTRFA